MYYFERRILNLVPNILQVLVLVLVGLHSPTVALAQFHAKSENGLVATVHPLASRAAVASLESGGNAVDAALSAAFMLGVVDGHNSGIGGGCFILIHSADGSVIAIDGREMAAAAAHRDMYLVNNKPDGNLSTTGPLAAAVPTAVAAYHLAWEHAGSLEWDQLVRPAAIIANTGVPISPALASAIKNKQSDLNRFSASAAIYLKDDGSPRLEGELLVQKDLAKTLTAIANNGPKAFYEGAFAVMVEDSMKEFGGIITANDLANAKAVIRMPVVTTYRDYTIIGMPPASSGGIHVAQVLNILERFNLAEIYREDKAQFYHLVIESLKLAFADRAYWLGDADYAAVPKNLISQRYANKLSRRIDPHNLSDVTSHGTPARYESKLFGKHTTHIAVADKMGNWVAITQTINTHMGSKFVIPGTGVLLNNEMDDFSIAPGIPNAFGLVGAKANEIAPGKRPLSSMSPTIVLKDGKPVLTLGAAGGPTIISQVIMGIIQLVDLGMNPEEQLQIGKIHHQWQPDHVRIERAVGETVIGSLRQKGHELKLYTRFGVRQMIYQDPNTGTYIGNTDSRLPGTVIGPSH